MGKKCFEQIKRMKNRQRHLKCRVIRHFNLQMNFTLLRSDKKIAIIALISSHYAEAHIRFKEYVFIPMELWIICNHNDFRSAWNRQFYVNIYRLDVTLYTQWLNKVIWRKIFLSPSRSLFVTHITPSLWFMNRLLMIMKCPLSSCTLIQFEIKW